MPLLLWTLFLVHSVAFAKPLGLESCGVYSFQGIPKIVQKKMILVLNEKTLSELVLDIPEEDQKLFAPYMDLVTKGELQVTEFPDHKTVTVKSLSKLDYGDPNPLNPAMHSFISLKSRQKCR